MSETQLSLQNNFGDTALSIAAIVGNVGGAKMLVEKYQDLTKIVNRDGKIPLIEAARHGHKDMVLYLLRYCDAAMLKDAESSADKPGVLLLNFLLTARFYDIALRSVLRSYSPLATMEFCTGDSPLSVLASEPSSFPSGMHPSYFNIFSRDQKIMHKQALELLKFLCQNIATQGYAKASSLIFNLIYEMGDYKRLLLLPVDILGNNILHLAAKLAPPDRLSITPCAALQMQRELQWYKEVERIVPHSFKEDKNSEGKTPAMLFTEAHCDLVKQSEKWMKETASSCSLVAVLIAAVVFAAAITVPGGTHQETGYPLLKHKRAFIPFAISDALSLFSAVYSILIFLSIPTARFTESDFLFTLPNRLIWGYLMLFMSITFMMLSFSHTLYLLFSEDMIWTSVPIGLFSCLPIYLFTLQFPLLSCMASPTYWPGGNIFNNQKRTYTLFAR
ncbi:hypothetical protein ACFE04_012494 [Oxalis oulophora]